MRMGKKVMGMQKMPTGVDNFRILREKMSNLLLQFR